MASSLPLNTLNAFEFSARHESVSTAADELNVTPAAVSQQIWILEELMGGQLSHRLNRGLALTAAERAGLSKLQDRFQTVNDAVKQNVLFKVASGNEQIMHRRSERGHGHFHRRFSLPDTADSENVKASGHNGVLEISIPKQAKAQPRRIQVAA